MQLAGLGGGAAPGAVAGPELLLYYSYYAQMLSALQTQQKLLQIQQQPSNNNNTTAAATTAIKDILSPLKLGNLASLNKDSNQVGNTFFRYTYSDIHYPKVCLYFRVKLSCVCLMFAYRKKSNDL